MTNRGGSHAAERDEVTVRVLRPEEFDVPHHVTDKLICHNE